MNRAHCLIGLACLAICSPAASAQSVAFSDFSSNYNSATYAYNPGESWAINRSGPFEQYVASQFVAGTSGTVADVILPVGYAGGTDGVLVQLLTDNAARLAPFWSLDDAINQFPGRFRLCLRSVLSGDGSAALSTGNAYWLAVEPVDPSYTGGWDFNDLNGGVTGNIAANFGDGTGWQYQSGFPLPAFEVDVTPTPEPATILALGMGAGSSATANQVRGGFRGSRNHRLRVEVMCG